MNQSTCFEATSKKKRILPPIWELIGDKEQDYAEVSTKPCPQKSDLAFGPLSRPIIQCMSPMRKKMIPLGGGDSNGIKMLAAAESAYFLTPLFD